MTDIVFSEKTSLAWNKDPAYNKYFLYQQQNYINELLKARGYVYKNQVYETLGLRWNPDDENTCYRAERLFIGFSFKLMDNNTITIKII